MNVRGLNEIADSVFFKAIDLVKLHKNKGSKRRPIQLAIHRMFMTYRQEELDIIALLIQLRMQKIFPCAVVCILKCTRAEARTLEGGTPCCMPIIDRMRMRHYYKVDVDFL